MFVLCCLYLALRTWVGAALHHLFLTPVETEICQVTQYMYPPGICARYDKSL